MLLVIFVAAGDITVGGEITVEFFIFVIFVEEFIEGRIGVAIAGCKVCYIWTGLAGSTV